MKDRTNIENYRAVSILNCFFKIYERFLYGYPTVYIDNISLDFMVAYRNRYSTNLALIRLVENWKKAIGNSLFAGGVLMDLSKAFNCISTHNLLTGKLHTWD